MAEDEKKVVEFKEEYVPQDEEVSFEYGRYDQSPLEANQIQKITISDLEGYIPYSIVAWTTYTALAWFTTVSSTHSWTTYTKRKEFTISHAWEYEVWFDLNTNNASYTAYWRVYVNWVATWAEHSTNSTSSVTFTDDITIVAWDSIELRTKIENAAAWVRGRNMYIKYDIEYDVTNTQILDI